MTKSWFLHLEMALVAEWRKDGLQEGRLLPEGQLHEGYVQMKQENISLFSGVNNDSKGIEEEHSKARVTNVYMGLVGGWKEQ